MTETSARQGLRVSFPARPSFCVHAIAVVALLSWPSLMLLGGCGGNGNTSSTQSITVSALLPTSGPVWTSVEIDGENFGTSTGTVKFNGAQAIVTNWSATSISAIVPNGTTSGPVSVTTAGNQSVSGPTFTVIAPGPSLIPFNSVYYHVHSGSLLAQLADDTGTPPTPRQQAILMVNNNFQALAAMGLNAVSISLWDTDDWPSVVGGGISYDPANPARALPQRAVAQEILLRIAAANNLKVIFVLSLSEYRRSTDGRAAWAGLADQYGNSSNPPGAWDFIHAAIDPTAYYGPLSTTELFNTIGIPDGPVGTYFDDPRIAAWLLAPEWNPAVSTHRLAFNKYWPYFYNLVHSNGSQTSLAGTYVIGAPDNPGASAMVPTIKTFKQWFASGTANPMPDFVGFEFYVCANSSYNLPNIYTDLGTMADAMTNQDTTDYPGDFSIPASQVFLGEGNSCLTTNGGENEYVQLVNKFAVDRGLKAVEWWESDSLQDGTPPDLAVTPMWDLFTISFTSAGQRTFSGLAADLSWHQPNSMTNFADPTTFTAIPEATNDLPTNYGVMTYPQPTMTGTWLQQALANHTLTRNVLFYANPNPIQSGGTGLGPTTASWDATQQSGVTSVEIHIGSPNGTTLVAGGPSGSAPTNSVSNGTVLYLQDVSGGKALTSANTLSTLTVQVQ
jgi:3D (Asp-Asp-Asp) domain-containing protein